MLRMALVSLAVISAATSRPETYLEYVARSVEYASDVVSELSGSEEPFVTMEALRPLAAANAAFLDGVAAPHNVSAPSTSALVAVPLLVQVPRSSFHPSLIRYYLLLTALGVDSWYFRWYATGRARESDSGT